MSRLEDDAGSVQSILAESKAQIEKKEEDKSLSKHKDELRKMKKQFTLQNPQ